MNTLTAPTIATSPRTHRAASVADWCFVAGWIMIAAAVAGWIWLMVPVWSSKAEMNDRFLIPAASIALIWYNWPRLRATALSPTSLGWVPLLIGAVAYALGWYVAVQVSSRTIVVWWLTGALMLLIAGMTLTHLGWRHLLLLLFPILFLVFALPTPGRIYNPLTLRLKQFTTSAAEHTLPWLGVNITRPDPESFELTLASGDLGVVEACSGVRSTIPLTAIAFLVAYVRRFGPLRWVLLIGLSVPIIAIANAVRVIVTGLLQENFGLSAISGWKHDALGYFAILFGLAMIVALSKLIAPRQAPSTSTVGPPVNFSQHHWSATMRALICLAILAPALASCIWAERFRVDHHVFVKLENLPTSIGSWTSETLEVPEPIIDELKCDQIIYRLYQNPQGQSVGVHVMFWANAATTAHQHHPDICYPSRGWQVTMSQMKPLDLANGAAWPISVRHYVKPEQQQVLFFWSQTGSHVLADGIEKPELMSGHSWILELLRHGHQPIDSGARLQVLLGTTTRGSIEPGNRLLRDFTREFANSLYEIAPWARPQATTPAQ